MSLDLLATNVLLDDRANKYRLKYCMLLFLTPNGNGSGMVSIVRFFLGNVVGELCVVCGRFSEFLADVMYVYMLV